MSYEQYPDTDLDRAVDLAVEQRQRIQAASDDEIEAALVRHGMPRRDARTFRRYRPMREFAAKFYLDTVDAKLGDPDAKARVEYCEEMWAKMREAKRQRAVRTQSS